MPQLIGLILVIALVFGGLALTGGRSVLHALPMELALIGGAALGTLLIGNTLSVAQAALYGFVSAFRGARWSRHDYTELLTLLSTLMRKARRGGFIAIEADIETPDASATFQSAPAVLADRGATLMICDAFRLMALDLSDARRAEDSMTRTLELNVDQRMKAVSALHTMADALPALGIVVAVLGIIRSMGAIDQSPAILGGMIATALLGTFLGVFLAYGIVGPVAARFGQIVEEEAQFLDTIRTVLSAYGQGLAPGVAIEMGRAAIPAAVQPDSETLEHAITAARFVATNTSSQAA